MKIKIRLDFEFEADDPLADSDWKSWLDVNPKWAIFQLAGIGLDDFSVDVYHSDGCDGPYECGCGFW